MKKITSLFTILIMLLALLTCPVTALAQDSEQSGLCSLALDSGSFSRTLSVSNSSTITYKSKTYYTQGKQLYNIVKNQIVAREDVLFNYYSTTKLSNIEDLIVQVVLKSCSDELSTTTTDGDYAMWNVFGYDYDYNVYKSNNKYFYDINVDMVYNANASQEALVTKAVDSFVSTIDFSKYSDYQIIRKVYDYICNATDYNYNAASATNINSQYNYRTSFSAYGALIEGSCVCQGYALAFYRICKELGYDVRFVNSDPNQGCHAWNMVMLDGEYYFVDCTWGDDYDTDDYFLVDYDTLRKNDTNFSLFSSSREHTLDSDLTTDSYFVENYLNYLTDDDYDCNASTLSNAVIYTTYSSYSYKGSAIKPTVYVKFSNQSLKKSSDYTVSYSNNTATGIAKINITGAGDYTGSAKRRFYIMPTKVSNFKSTSVTNSSVKLSWNTSSGSVSGYRIYRYKNGSWYSVKSVSSSATSATISSLSSSTTYRFKIKPYKTTGGKTIYGMASDVYVVATKPSSPSIKSLTTKSKSLTVSWKKVTCTGYQVQYSTSSNMNSCKSYYTSYSASSKKISSLKKGKRYYVRVRAYKEYTDSSGKKQRVYSNWSTKKSIVVK